MNTAAQKLIELVDRIKTASPAMPLSDAIALAVAAQQAELLNDLIVVVGDCADALNDMRPTVVPRSKMH